MMAGSKIAAPWDGQIVRWLNHYQTAGSEHPFTCENRPHSDNPEGILIATASGWKCASCEYRQTWAWARMAVPPEELPDPRELAGRHVHQTFLMDMHPGMTPRDTANAWQGLAQEQREAYMQAGAAQFEAGKTTGPERLPEDLHWLLAAGMEITIGYVQDGDASRLRCAVDFDGDPEWITDSLAEGFAFAKAFCQERGIAP